ncbi:ornithine cyclodeaminase [Dechloromonas sp. XY25]|uniref:Ornithine cyclodeaminase n=1 Tax=Dechloromonas hankyongensis TaxID=2908002 RepID=A0ABS9K4Z6_9RHOO|nr:ornithine cyclodeaminase [Dechloromonas hankyongensis]MCG2578180.1 ornithine cyclodeaminase [Dechloromonas hankyongensis]
MPANRPLRTRFLSAERAARMIMHQGLAACLERLATYLVEDCRRWPEFDKTPRVASHSADGVIELMPISDHDLYAFKYVNGHPKNHRLGLSTVMAFGVLADVESGMPMLVSELTLTTALRTAAMSAVAARALARPNCRRMALIGNGAQSEFQAVAFNRLLGIDEFHLFDTDPAATAKLQHNLIRLGLVAHHFASTREAVRGCDIVTTATADKTNATILTPDMVEPGMHLNAIGGDCPGKTELHRGVLEMGKVFVEYEAQTRIEGELQQMPADFAVTELWQVLTGQLGGRSAADEVTIFDSVGFALEDYSALRFMRDLAIELGVDEEIALIPDLPDPKNLFGLIAGEGQAVRGSASAPAEDSGVPVAA